MEVVAASPNNTYFASGGWDNKICIYKNDSTFELAQQLDGHNAAVSALAFSRDGKSLISGGKDYKVIIWKQNAETGLFENVKEITMIHTAGINCVLFGPGMRNVYSAGDDGRIMIYDLTKNTSKIIENKIPVRSIALSTNRRFIFCADESTVVKQYDGLGNLVKQFEGHTDYVNAVKYSMDNKYLVSGGNDKTAIVWEVMSGKVKYTLAGHEWKITAIDISLDSKYVITGSIDGTVKLWSLETGELMKTCSANGEKVRTVALSADEQCIIGGMHFQLDPNPVYGPVIWKTGVSRVTPKAPGGQATNRKQLTPEQRKQLGLPDAPAGTQKTAPNTKTTANPLPPAKTTTKPNKSDKKVINKTDEVEVTIEEEAD